MPRRSPGRTRHTPTMPVDRRIVVPFRVRFDEATPTGALRTSSHLRLAQEAAWVHSASAGFGLAWYQARGRYWVVRTIDLVVHRPVGHGEIVAVSTEVVAMRRFWARRVSEFVNEAGELAAEETIDWIMTNAQGRPTRVPGELTDAFPEPVTREPGSQAARPDGIELQPTPADAAGRTFAVRRHELDPMAHVNNAVYADYVEEAIDAAGGSGLLDAVPRRCRLEYLVPARPEATLASFAWRSDAGWSCRLVGDGVELLRARLEPLDDHHATEEAR